MAIIQDNNGTSMITYTAPDFRAGEDVFLEKIRTDYIGTKLKENIKGTVKDLSGKTCYTICDCGCSV